MAALTRRTVVASMAGAASVLARASLAQAARPDILVAAASDLQQALPDVIARFQAETGLVVTPTYGSTGNFARQIRQGAPFELFLAADEQFIERLAQDGVLPDMGVVYAHGRLALVAAKRGMFGQAVSLTAVAAAVRAGQPFRCAIANPEHAPYGQRAVEVLQRQGVYDALLPRLVFGDSVAQAMQFVASGAVPVGLVAHSLLKAAAEAVSASEIPADWHSPLVQRMALTAKARPGARQFYAFLQTAAVRTILARHHLDPG
jgi:molybdate transport system substrate-binding protein